MHINETSYPQHCVRVRACVREREREREKRVKLKLNIDFDNALVALEQLVYDKPLQQTKCGNMCA